MSKQKDPRVRPDDLKPKHLVDIDDGARRFLWSKVHSTPRDLFSCRRVVVKFKKEGPAWHKT
jgi:hypothetical protein